MNLTEKVAVALARERYRRNMLRDPPLTPEQILAAVAVHPESYADLLGEALAAIEAIEAFHAHDEAACHICQSISAGIVAPYEHGGC